jgi:hydrogenase/urease accessory protein HupE
MLVHAHGDAGLAHGVADGVSVFFGSLQYLLPIIGAALVASRDSKTNVIGALLAVLAGMLLGTIGRYVVSDALSIVLLARSYLILLGLIVTIDMRLPTNVTLAICFLAGALVGLEYGITPLGDPKAEPGPVSAFMLSAALVFSVVAFSLMRYRSGWQRIAIRVAGSWIAAIGTIYGAFLLKQVL